MTYKDLCTSVAALGFESFISDQESLLCAVRRAVGTLFVEKEVRGIYEIYQTPRTPSEVFSDFIHTGAGVESFTLNARAVSFKTEGVGEYTVRDALSERTISFGKDEGTHKEILHGEATLSFRGDYAYSVFDLAAFDALFGPNKEDVPLRSSYREYDLYSLIPSFLAPVFVPTDEYGIEIPDATISSATLRVPASYHGKVRIVYKKAPTLPSGNQDEEIILPTGCDHLLPLLCAAYFWLDDDEDKAAYYMSLYREGMLTARRSVKDLADTSYKNVNGWA